MQHQMSDGQDMAERDDLPSTGDDHIDAALAELAGIEAEPLARHIEVGEAVHQVLQGRLGGLSGA